MLMAIGKTRRSFAHHAWPRGFHGAFTTKRKVVCDGNFPHRAFNLDHLQRPVCWLAPLGLSKRKGRLSPVGIRWRACTGSAPSFLRNSGKRAWILERVEIVDDCGAIGDLGGRPRNP